MKLILDGIKKSFEGEEVLRHCSYTFLPGRIYGLLGRNGAGKTTLMRILYGDLSPDEGTFTLVEDQKPVALEGNVGMTFSENILPEFMSGFEFVKFLLDLNPQRAQKDTPKEYLSWVGFEERDIHRLIKDYSDGMKSKLSLLSIFILDPKVILMDEPLTALDIVIGGKIKEVVRYLKKDHIILISTHVLDIAENLCEEIVLLKNGTLSSFSGEGGEFEKRLVEELSHE